MIYAITHKPFDDTILDKDVYKVILVGNKKNICSYQRDDVGDNIADKNESYCELTGLYWAWKNDNIPDNEITGLIHYRRFFTTKIGIVCFNCFHCIPKPMPFVKINKVLEKYDVILPFRVKTRSIKSEYAFYHKAEDIDLTRSVITKIYPEYLNDFDTVMEDLRYYYYGNMLICKGALLKKYCEWIFPILEELENIIDFDKYDDPYQKRVIGFIAERLLQVWTYSNRLKIKEYPVSLIGREWIPPFRHLIEKLHEIINGAHHMEE